MLPYLLLLFALGLLLERLLPGWTLPRVPTWKRRAFALNATQALVLVLAGYGWQHYYRGFALLHLSAHLPAWGAGLLGYLAATFVYYWWHRWRHRVDFLWQHFHQVHHSPQRIEVATSFYKHPLEMLANFVIGAGLLYVGLGLSPAAGAVCTLCSAAGDLFYHANIRTPRWVGFVLQRPEMHRVHHEYERHRHNYGDLVLWDYLFGTYHNPADFTATCGFDEALELQLGPMLRFRDVHRQPAAE